MLFNDFLKSKSNYGSKKHQIIFCKIVFKQADLQIHQSLRFIGIQTKENLLQFV